MAEQGDRDGNDERALAQMGYAQELLRSVGGFSSFALSFSIISILTGVLSSYKMALREGGPGGLGLGWPIVSAGTLVVALAMAELASAFPTAGALYHWAALLGGRGAGWMVAATNLVGQVAIVAAIDLGCADSIGTMFGWDVARTDLPVFVVIVVTHLVVNALSFRLVAWLNDASAVVHIVGVLVLCGLLFAFGKHHDAGWLADRSHTFREDGNPTLGFLGAMTLGMWTMTGYDASAHVSEETRDPSRRAPIGILSSVVVSAVFGFALVAGLTLAIDDLPAVANADNPPLAIFDAAIGHRFGAAAIGLATLAMWFCGLSAMTSASRTFFAFARDGGLPGSSFVRRVHPRWKTPVAALGVAATLSVLLVVGTRVVGGKAFEASTSLATTALYVSYGVPIALGVDARLRGRWTTKGPFDLGRAGIVCGLIAVAWCAFVVVVFALPPNQVYGLALGATLALLAAGWLFVARRRFAGPKITLADLGQR